jgi:hypothetical protein
VLLAWIVFPLVLALLSLGCGLLVECISRLALPGALLLPLGLALLIVEADLVTMSGATARLAAPLAVAFAVAGLGLTRRRRRKPGVWPLAGGVAVFAVYAAPIVLSGQATFAGYITLDDTSTWLAMTARVMDHGRSLAGMGPSSYQQVLTDYIGGGTPLGALLPLGLGGKLTGDDIAWLFQPTIAFYGAMLALTIYALIERLVAARPLRALVAFVGAQPALLFAYSLWSGIKETATAPLIALTAALVGATLGAWGSFFGAIPAAVAVAALFAVLSPAGAVWLVLPVVIVLALLAARGARAFARSAGSLVALVAVLSVPSLAIASTFLRGAAGDELTASNEVANLGHPLDTLQLFGIWPATDFRSRPHDGVLINVLIGVVVAATAGSLVAAVRRRAWALPLYVAAAVGGVTVLILLRHVGLSSPWLSAKAMAEASPALVTAAGAGAALLFEGSRRLAAAVLGAALAAGVLWSNGLAYSNVWLAPRAQLAELQEIGQRFAGAGPTLMTEPEPYGDRYFLRRMDPEGASDRRRRLVPLLDGTGLSRGSFADLDRFQLDGILVYKTLVLPSSPVESRPPSIYRLLSHGQYYDVWQRPDSYPTIVEHFPLGSAAQPGAVPPCGEIGRLAALAGPTGRVAAAPRAAVVQATLSEVAHPASWPTDSSGLVYPNGPGTIEAVVRVARAGRYRLWLGGSFRSRVRAFLDGRLVADERDYLNDGSHYAPLGAAELAAGLHDVRLDVSGPDLHPGSGGYPVGMGPLVLGRSAGDGAVVEVASAAAEKTLCGRRLDWVEALRG